MKTNIDKFNQWEQLMISTYGSNGKIAVLYIIEALRQQKNKGLAKLPTLFFVGRCGTGKTSLAESIMTFFDYESICLCTISNSVLKQTIDPQKAILFESYTDNNCDGQAFKLIKQNASPDKQYNRPMIVTSQETPLKDDGYFNRHCIILNFESREFETFETKPFNQLKELEKVHTETIKNTIISNL